MTERLNESHIRKDFQFGVLAATVANFSMNKDPDKPALNPWDFFATVREPEVREQSPDEMLLVIEALMAEKGRKQDS